MHRTARLAVACYIILLSMALLIGRWPLQGPVLVPISNGHGVHLGDAVLLLVSAVVALGVLTGRPQR